MTLDPAAIRARANAATKELDALTSGHKRWAMRIPATETDILISAALGDIPALLDRVGLLEAENWRLGKIRASANRWRERTIAAELERDRLTNRIAAVRELHQPVPEPVITGPCAVEECGHEDECPTLPFDLCAGCYELAQEINFYYGEESVSEVEYPCPTIQALDKEAL